MYNITNNSIWKSVKKKKWLKFSEIIHSMRNLGNTFNPIYKVVIFALNLDCVWHRRTHTKYNTVSQNENNYDIFTVESFSCSRSSQSTAVCGWWVIFEQNFSLQAMLCYCVYLVLLPSSSQKLMNTMNIYLLRTITEWTAGNNQKWKTWETRKDYPIRRYE